jgi:hypothetical protein
MRSEERRERRIHVRRQLEQEIRSNQEMLRGWWSPSDGEFDGRQFSKLLPPFSFDMWMIHMSEVSDALNSAELEECWRFYSHLRLVQSLVSRVTEARSSDRMAEAMAPYDPALRTQSPTHPRAP